MSFLNPQKLIDHLKLEPGIQVADFGCGSGNITVLMAKKVGNSGRVMAIDVLKTALQTVEGRAKLEGIHNIKTIQANLEDVDSSGLEESRVDFVLIANALFQSPGQKEIIKEAERVLKPGGRLVIVDWLPKKGNLGPKAKYRIEASEVKKMAQNLDLTFVRSLPKKVLGKYHFGLEFKK